MSSRIVHGDAAYTTEFDSNAEELVDDFWKKHPKKHANATRKSRQSTGGESLSEAGKKRGRKSTAREDSEEEAPASSRTTKKAKRGPKAMSPIELPPTNMNTYMHLSSWEDIISSVDTVERTPDGKLFVYFTLYVSGF